VEVIGGGPHSVQPALEFGGGSELLDLDVAGVKAHETGTIKEHENWQ
jgi:hypothetical protein